MHQEKPKDPKGIPFRDHHLIIYEKKCLLLQFWAFEEACRETVSLEKMLEFWIFGCKGRSFCRQPAQMDALFAQNEAV